MYLVVSILDYAGDDVYGIFGYARHLDISEGKASSHMRACKRADSVCVYDNVQRGSNSGLHEEDI